MTAAVLTETVTLDGRALTPGEVFRPVREHPEYWVVFVGLSGTTATFADCCGTWSQPLTPREIP